MKVASPLAIKALIVALGCAVAGAGCQSGEDKSQMAAGEDLNVEEAPEAEAPKKKEKKMKKGKKGKKPKKKKKATAPTE